MGRGSGGVAQTKGKNFDAQQERAARATAWVKFRSAIENGKPTDSAEKSYASNLKQYSLYGLEKEVKALVEWAVRYEYYSKMNPTDTNKTAAKVADKMESLARKELMKRDKSKQDGSWYAQVVANSRKKYYK